MFARMFGKWALKKQKQEFERFISSLSAMDGSEIGMVVAVATEQRHRLSKKGIYLLRPFEEISKDPMINYTISSAVKDLQKQNKPQAAAGMMVWLFTLRAAAHPELRSFGRKLWGQLERGFPHVGDASVQLLSLTARPLDTEGYHLFPDGLDPFPK